jgi:hypothetical protein
MHTPALIVFTALSLASSAASAGIANELIVNGGFETGDFTGWSPFAVPDSEGVIFVTNLAQGASLPYSGGVQPGGGDGGVIGLAAGPSSGEWYAAIDQDGPGAYALEQAFTTDINATQWNISFDIFAGDSTLSAPLNSGNFDPFGDPTQYLRVDLYDITGQHIANLYDATPNYSYESISVDVSALLTAGDTYYIRMEHVDTTGYFHSALDNVSVSQNVPAPSALALLTLSAASTRRNRR